ncbi:hypothetical protein [Polycladidibacter stylochi]|uniref:hypothetical protein n=1 Tax=Polycladidibacter stylochi TaxID=1807766 RepID=UPI00083029A5|nr:hypothetical protein [Pseudovibrio stylochi]
MDDQTANAAVKATLEALVKQLEDTTSRAKLALEGFTENRDLQSQRNIVFGGLAGLETQLTGATQTLKGIEAIHLAARKY